MSWATAGPGCAGGAVSVQEPGVRLLMVGDVVGRAGRRTAAELLPELKRELGLDFLVVQGENIAGGFGLTRETVDELLDAGANVITSGNHVWARSEFIPHLDDESVPVVRPANYPEATPGRGVIVLGRVVVVCLIGRLFMDEAESPFAAADRVLENLGDGKTILVDFHAEATSEKQAMGWHLDGRVAAVAGTHTHVPTADTRVLPGGTAYVSDVGMVGAADSIIGMQARPALQRFLNPAPMRLTVENSGPMMFNSVMIETDDSTGLALSIGRVDRRVDG